MFLRGYISKYKITNESGQEQVIFTQISDEELKNPNFIEFLNRTILNTKYLDYAIKENSGYLGIPRRGTDGSYTIEFDAEELVATRKYMNKEQTKESNRCYGEER